MAATADLEYRTRGETKTLRAVGGAADTLYKGGIVNFGTDGLLKVAADVAGEVPAGVMKKQVAVAGSNAEVIEVERGLVRLPHSGAAATDVGKLFYATADDTLAESASNVAPLGMCVDWESGFLWIDMDWQSSGELMLGSLKIRSGSATFTGTDTDIDTGLTTISQVVVTVKDTNQAAGDAAYVTVDHGADGLLDVYAWDDAGSAASNACTIYWIAIGQ